MLSASILQEQDAKSADTHYDICHFVTDSINLAFPLVSSKCSYCYVTRLKDGRQGYYASAVYSTLLKDTATSIFMQ